MSNPTLLIVGGGLAGLSAGCYARASGIETTIVEHGLALGGVCTAWPRGPYVVDGCIHWLTGGAFARLYEELGILPAVPLQVLDHWVTWRDMCEGHAVAVTRDLDKLGRDLKALGPEDAAEIDRLITESVRFATMEPPIDKPAEITPFFDQLRGLWEMRGSLPAVAHYRKPMRAWVSEHFESLPLRRFFGQIMPEDAPAMTLLMVFGYLQRGWLSRPQGGTAAFRDALVAEYHRLGGASLLCSTVDEIVVEDDRARGVRLDDGRILTADAVICTSSMPETVLRLLGGRYGAAATRERMQSWKMFSPIVLASVGVDVPLAGVPPMLAIELAEPFTVCGTPRSSLYLRVCNDDPVYAPQGHAVVQAMLETDYAYWASRGTGYESAKDEVAAVALEQMSRALPELRGHAQMTDIATPLTYWQKTRSWRGAYEGWMPNASSMFGHVQKKLPGLAGFVMAGQWVEPGGGVPTAIMSGRQAVQILCADEGRPFAVPARPKAS